MVFSACSPHTTSSVIFIPQNFHFSSSVLTIIFSQAFCGDFPLLLCPSLQPCSCVAVLSFSFQLSYDFLVLQRPLHLTFPVLVPIVSLSLPPPSILAAALHLTLSLHHSSLPSYSAIQRAINPQIAWL